LLGSSLMPDPGEKKEKKKARLRGVWPDRIVIVERPRRKRKRKRREKGEGTPTPLKREDVANRKKLGLKKKEEKKKKKKKKEPNVPGRGPRTKKWHYKFGAPKPNRAAGGKRKKEKREARLGPSFGRLKGLPRYRRREEEKKKKEEKKRRPSLAAWERDPFNRRSPPWGGKGGKIKKKKGERAAGLG